MTSQRKKPKKNLKLQYHPAERVMNKTAETEVSGIIQKPNKIFKLDHTFLSNVNCIEEATDQ